MVLIGSLMPKADSSALRSIFHLHDKYFSDFQDVQVFINIFQYVSAESSGRRAQMDVLGRPRKKCKVVVTESLAFCWPRLEQQLPGTSYDLTQMHPVVRSSIAIVPRTSIRFPCRRLSNRRFPQPNRRFHQAGNTRASEGGTNKSDGAITNRGGQKTSEGSPAENGVPEKDSCTALSAPSVKDLAHYGSAARRSKRGRSHQEVTPSVRYT